MGLQLMLFYFVFIILTGSSDIVFLYYIVVGLDFRL